MKNFTLIFASIVIVASAFGCSKRYFNFAPESPGAPKKDKAIVDEGEYFHFNDLNLEHCVKTATIGRDENYERIRADKNGDGKISKAEAAEIKSLNCSGQGIRSMNGIEKLENLEYINCSANDMGVLPRFSELKKLTTLRCVNNFFTDADCNELERLRLSGLDILTIKQQRDGRQLTCDQVKLVGHIRNYSDKTKADGSVENGTNDVWGFVHDGREFAVYGDHSHVHIVEVSDREPYVKKIASLPRGVEGDKLFGHPNHSIWGEYRYFAKDGKAYIYASTEGNWSFREDGDPKPYLQVFDVTDIDQPKEVKVKDLHPGLWGIHNITLDAKRGLLFAFGGTNYLGKKNSKGRLPSWKGARIYSLNDPLNPQYIRTVGKYYIHDAQIKSVYDTAGSLVSSRLFVAHGTTKIHWDANETTNEENRFTVYDLKDLTLAKIPMLWDQQYPYGYSHNIWTTEDEKFVVVTGETSIDKQLSLWELSRGPNGEYQSEFRNGLNLQGAALAHNAFIKGNHIYLSHYTKGVQVAELFDTPTGEKNMRLKWAYDTFPFANSSDMEGSWGVFPFTQNPNIFFATDISTGFYVFKKSSTFLSEEN